MTDCFALLDEPRRPWLDADALKDKFHTLSSKHHPDVATGGDADFPGLNAAYRTLQDPKTRLRHLLELEFPGVIARKLEIPPDIARLFETMARESHSVGEFLEKKALAGTPIEAALMASERIELLSVLEKLLALLIQKRDGIFMQLKFIDAVWEEDRDTSAGTLVDIYQSISYINRWIDQLREDMMKLGEV